MDGDYEMGYVSVDNRVYASLRRLLMPQTRISEWTREVIRRISRETGQSSEQIVGQAIDRLERERLLDAINAGFTSMREDEEAWSRERSERALWDATLADGSTP